MNVLPRSILWALLVPPALVLVGTIGLQILEGLSFFESLYLTVMTITTVGYGDFVPKTTNGRIFTMSLVLSGVFIMFYAATALIRMVVSGELAELVGKKQMERTLAQMKDHVIVCGFGRMGKLVCAEFAKAKTPFVIVDNDSAKLQEFSMPYGVALAGDATADDVLRHAGIDRARSLVTVMPSDAENLFTTMSARLLSADLFIVARVEDIQSEQKLMRAGANRVISPYQIGGSRVAQAVLRPTVMDFLELATRTEHIELQLEETCIGDKSSLIGSNLRDSQLRAELKIIIVAIKKLAGHMIFNPAPDTILEAGDILIALGHKEHLQQMEVLANPE